MRVFNCSSYSKETVCIFYIEFSHIFLYWLLLYWTWIPLEYGWCQVCMTSASCPWTMQICHLTYSSVSAITQGTNCNNVKSLVVVFMSQHVTTWKLWFSVNCTHWIGKKLSTDKRFLFSLFPSSSGNVMVFYWCRQVYKHLVHISVKCQSHIQCICGDISDQNEHMEGANLLSYFCVWEKLFCIQALTCGGKIILRTLTDHSCICLVNILAKYLLSQV